MHTFTRLLVVAISLSAVAGVRAQNPKRAFSKLHAATRISEIVAEILPDKPNLSVEEFRAFASTDVGMAQMVGEQLVAKGFRIAADAPLRLSGDLSRLLGSNDLPIGMKIAGRLTGPQGAVSNFSVEVLNSDDGAKLGETGEAAAPPDPRLVNANGTSADPIVQPTLVNGRLKASPRSPYAMEVLVETGKLRDGQIAYTVRPIVKDPRGTDLYYVSLKKGEIIAVRLFNESGFDAAAEVEMDGLSRFSLANDPALHGGLDLISPSASRIVKGYYTDDKSVASFRVGTFGEDVARKLHSKGVPALQTITVSFRAAWLKGQDAPPNEPPTLKSPVIVPGPPRLDPTVTVKREIGHVRSVLKVRYEVAD